MNTENTQTPSPTNIQAVDFSSESKQLHRKIAKLPKPLRDIINSALDDSLPAKEIIQKLEASTNPPLPYPINEANISRWKTTGYLRYLAHQDHLESIEASREAALEMVASNNLSLPQATLQVIASQCFEILADFSATAVKEKLAADPLKYTSFLHVFARLTREMVHLEKFQEARAAAEAERAAAQKKAQENWFEDVDAYLLSSPNKTNSTDENDTRQSQPDAPAPAAPPPQPISPGPEIAQPAPSHKPHPVPESLSPPPSAAEPSRANTAVIIAERCLDCRYPLPPLTAEGKRPQERCQNCGILLPPPGLCTRPSKDPCCHCGTNLPARLPSGRRPRPTCHNCGAGLGRELDEDIQKYRTE